MPPSSGFTPTAFPEAKSFAFGVSVEYTHEENRKWYVFRASYGREDRALDYIVAHGTYAYIAKRETEKIIKGRRRRVLKSLIPGLLFAYATDKEAEEYVKQSPEIPFLSFYYNHFQHNAYGLNPPLTIPCKEMENFMLATLSHNRHLMFVEPSRCHFKSGDQVRVVEGPFIGVEGRVARLAGQQRVVLQLPEVGLISTAYIPTAFIQKI